jgi:hypothetical protein
VDLLFNFFTGYKCKHASNFIVLNQSSIIR